MPNWTKFSLSIQSKRIERFHQLWQLMRIVFSHRFTCFVPRVGHHNDWQCVIRLPSIYWIFFWVLQLQFLYYFFFKEISQLNRLTIKLIQWKTQGSLSWEIKLNKRNSFNDPLNNCGLRKKTKTLHWTMFPWIALCRARAMNDCLPTLRI